MGVGDKSYDYFCVNSGFNCRYPEQEEIEDGIGCCYAWSCPLCNTSNGLICAKCGVECEDCGTEDSDCSHPLRSGVPGGAARPSQRGICCHPQAAGPPCGSLRAVCLPVEVHEGGFPGTLILQWNPTVPFLPARRMADGSPSWR